MAGHGAAHRGQPAICLHGGQQGAGFTWNKRPAATAQPLQQLSIAFLLAGNDIIDDHRHPGRKTFMHRGPPRFGDHHIVLHQQPGHLPGPADQFNRNAGKSL